jgi:hypothetical protein
MRLAELDAFMDRVKHEDNYGGWACKYGHNGCSDRQGGRCSDEAWQQQCSDESDEEYDERMEGE